MLSTVTWSHHTRWPPASRHVADARRFVTRRLAQEGLADLAETAALVVSELATNAVVHARSWFGVRLERRQGRVVLEVHDESDVLPRLDHAGTLDVGGRGLYLVDALSQDWGVRSEPRGGKCVWVELEVPPRPPV